MSNPLVRLTPQQLAQLPEKGQVTIDGQRYQVQLIHAQQITQHDSRSAYYQTAKSRGVTPPPGSRPQLPSMLAISLATVIALSFLVAASMFSISLTAYSNSVERIDRTRSFIRVE